MKKLWLSCAKSAMILISLVLLSGCASKAVMPGVVLEAPSVSYPLVPPSVLQRKQHPPGYWTNKFLDDLEGISTQ